MNFLINTLEMQAIFNYVYTFFWIYENFKGQEITLKSNFWVKIDTPLEKKYL